MSGLLLLLVLLLTGMPSRGQDLSNLQNQASDVVAERQKMLAVEAASIAREKSELATWKQEFASRSAELTSRSIELSEIQLANLAVQARKVAMEAIALDIAAAEQNRNELTDTINGLEDQLQALAADPGTGTPDKVAGLKTILAQKRSLLALASQHIEQLTLRNMQARERLALEQQWAAVLRDTYQNQQEKARQQTLEELHEQLAAEINQWQAAAKKFKLELGKIKDDPYVSRAQRDLMQTQLLEAEESIFLIEVREKLAQARIQFEEINAGTPASLTEPRLAKTRSDKLKALRNQLKTLLELLDTKGGLMDQRLEVTQRREELDKESSSIYRNITSIINQLKGKIENLAAELKALRIKVKEQVALLDSAYLEMKKRDLTLRHKLPRSLDEWRPLIAELNNLPTTLLQMGRNIRVALKAAMQQADMVSWSLLVFLGSTWLLMCLALGRLPHPDHFKETGSFTRKILHVVTSLLRNNRFGLLVTGLLIITGWIMDIIPPWLAVISILAAIWLGARFISGISWWILKSPLGLPDKQPRLYRLTVFLVILMSFFSLAMVLAHLGFLSSPFRELVNRGFMLLLLPPAYLALRLRALLMEILKERKGSVYWVRLLGFAGFIVPLAILSAALLGIAGYINLAWMVAGHLSKFIAVVAGWLIVRGLVMDLASTIAAILARKSERSQFWVRSLVDPVQHATRLALFLITVLILYRMFGGDPTTGLDLRSWLSAPLFKIGETPIDSLDLLWTLLLLVLVFYTGRWAREVTYGWLYGGVQDLGIRNSLSVFTQYAVVVLGLLIALNILGINLTSLTVFAGALGVGIGFGLQNIANNFISGLILLAERPVRTKDWVTIGSNEGEVSQIGMRSVTVTTWDNQDVIIPNSDLISSAFVNWTHTNNIVRTVLIIGIRYQNDPHLAQQVIEEAVIMQPEVVLDPKPRAWLSEFSASSVDFRVQYHIDVHQHSRMEVKSKVMFAIWDALEEADIGIPFPQQDIYIKELPAERTPLPASKLPAISD